MQKILKLCISAVLLLTAVSALASTAKADVGGFSVTIANFPENHNPETRGFFDLRVYPGQQQEIEVSINNQGDTPFYVEIELVTATTNRNGIVNYSPGDDPDESMVHPFSEIARLTNSGDRILEIPANGRVIVPITINVPEEGFEGIILGSIFVLRAITEAELAASGMIVNRFANVLIVRLQESDTDVNTNFLLGDVDAMLDNGRAAIIANIRNPQPRLVTGVVANASIYPLNGNSPIFVRGNVKVDFAPNSVFPFLMIDEAGFGLHPGEYIARISLEHEGVTWDFEREFEIFAQQAEAINTGAINIQQQQHPVTSTSTQMIIIAALVGAGFTALIAVIVFLKIRVKNLENSKGKP